MRGVAVHRTERKPQAAALARATAQAFTVPAFYPGGLAAFLHEERHRNTRMCARSILWTVSIGTSFFPFVRWLRSLPPFHRASGCRPIHASIANATPGPRLSRRAVLRKSHLRGGVALALARFVSEVRSLHCLRFSHPYLGNPGALRVALLLRARRESASKIMAYAPESTGYIQALRGRSG